MRSYCSYLIGRIFFKRTIVWSIITPLITNETTGPIVGHCPIIAAMTTQLASIKNLFRGMELQQYKAQRLIQPAHKLHILWQLKQSLQP